VHRLEPAALLVYEAGGTQVERYWLPEGRVSTRSLPQLQEELREALQSAVGRYELGESGGVFLSGGIDSSTVAGMAQRLHKQAVPAYTIGFDAAGYDELEFARQSADHFGASVHEYYVTPDDVAEALPVIASRYDQPFGNPSAVGVLYCARLARGDGKTMLLAGDGGDELFAGNARYAKQKMLDLYRHVPSVLREYLCSPFADSGLVPQVAGLGKLQSYIRQARTPMPRRMESYNVLANQASDGVLDAAFQKQIDVRHPEQLLSDTYDLPDLPDILQRMLYLDWKFTLADNDLRKVIRMCEVGGVEVEFPLLDERLVDLAMSVPPKWLLKGRELRFFFKDALRDFLPPSTLTKKKQGFGVPFGVWLSDSDALQNAVYPLLESLKQRGIIKTEFIDMLLRGHRDTHQHYFGSAIWPLVMLEQWLQMHRADLQF